VFTFASSLFADSFLPRHRRLTNDKPAHVLRSPSLLDRLKALSMRLIAVINRRQKGAKSTRAQKEQQRTRRAEGNQQRKLRIKPIVH
jgi:hypothetical protein